MTYDTIIVESRGRVGLVTLNRPKALNALSTAVANEVVAALAEFDADEKIGAIVITGSERAFAAGADIAEMAQLDFPAAYHGDFVSGWDRVAEIRKPIIAAVAGYALGGGCELAMLCDFIIASDKAKFGQPEINLGVAPGIGGSQRLTRLVGKSKAMDMVLTARMMDAAEAERAGLASRVFPHAELMDEVRKIAARIAAQSPLAVMANKEMVNAALETTLTQGVQFERRLFHSLFAFDDQKEGMAAFVEKRKPEFKGA